jgi:Uma2 family endonuclease
MVIRETQRYTQADLRALEAQAENADKRFELINGVIIEMPTPEPLHNYIVSMFVRRIGRYLDDHPIGVVFGDNVSYALPTGDELIPDASYIANEQLRYPLPKKFTFAPDLAIVISAPCDGERDLLDRAEMLLQSGVRVVWIVYSVIREIDVCHWGNGLLYIDNFDADGVIDGEEVLPGFSLPVKSVFPPAG